MIGDDKVLVRYLNPNMVAIVTGGIGPVRVVQNTSSTESVTTVSEVYSLHLSIVDSVSSKVIYRTNIEDAESPVSISIVENSIVTTYWNAKVFLFSRFYL